jgi:hypothetical protein
MLRLACVVSLALASGACTLHFGGDDGGDDSCPPSEADEAPGAPLELRDPSTLQCQAFGGGGYCDERCPCAEDYPASDAVPIPSWGWCESPCNGLAEDTCLLASECRAVYDWGCLSNDSICPLETPFLGCYPVDQSGPINGDSCLGLDAWECSKHNDCIALHTEQCSGDTRDCWQEFVECWNEAAPPPY